MDDYWSYIGVGVSCFVLGWVISHWYCIRTFGDILDYFGITVDDLENMNLEELLVDQEEESDENEVAITVEQVNGQLFAYTKENPRFLAQGRNREELITALGEKLSDVTILISEGDEGFEIMTVEN
jgi:molybdopterin converting factor small subunit